MAASLRAEQQALTRDRLLDAASRLFAAHGFDGTSVAQIAAHAGMTTGAIYSNFTGKADLFAAVVERRMSRQVDDYRKLYAFDGLPAERIEAGAGRWMRLIADEPEYFPLYIEVWRVALDDPDIRQRLRSAYRKLIDELAALMKQDAPAISPTVDDETLAHFALIVCSLADGLALHKILDPDRVPNELLGGFLRSVIESQRSDRPAP